MSESYRDTEKRSGPDRRKRPTSPLSWSSLRGRRRFVRRKEERNIPHYVDRYEGSLTFIVIAIMILTLLDAFFTLILINHGARELNPIMGFLLSKGEWTFLLGKYLLTALCITILIIHKNFFIFQQKIRLKDILYCLFTLYLFLIVYEIYGIKLL